MCGRVAPLVYGLVCTSINSSTSTPSLVSVPFHSLTQGMAELCVGGAYEERLFSKDGSCHLEVAGSF